MACSKYKRVYTASGKHPVNQCKSERCCSTYVAGCIRYHVHSTVLSDSIIDVGQCYTRLIDQLQTESQAKI